MCVNNPPKVAVGSAAAWIRTREIRLPNHSATEPDRKKFGRRFYRGSILPTHDGYRSAARARATDDPRETARGRAEVDGGRQRQRLRATALHRRLSLEHRTRRERGGDDCVAAGRTGRCARCVHVLFLFVFIWFDAIWQHTNRSCKGVTTALAGMQKHNTSVLKITANNHRR